MDYDGLMMGFGKFCSRSFTLHPRSSALTFIDVSLSQVTLPEHTPPGSTVVTVTATDRDSGENGKITYSVMSSTQDGFYVDPNNGLLHSFSSLAFF